MMQITQNIRDGKRYLQQIPSPVVGPGEVLIANQASLVSAGTEKMVMDLAKKSLLGKAKERPDQVRRVLEKIRNEGLFETIQQVRKKLDEPMTMGYSSAGIVLACGSDVQTFKPGDRVASNGPHAEVVSVPRNLCAHIPELVTYEQASFAVLGSIAMQGVRLAKCELGSTVFVIGLGLVGQLTVGILSAAGIRVIGTDLAADRCELALRMGATDASPGLRPSDVTAMTRGLGADAVIITASTKSNGPIESAVNSVRKKGRVVLVGVAGLELDRRPWFFKEAEFVVSCSYGPGRYDVDYEDRGHDYPAPYVRWTEQRNIQAVLDLIGSGKLRVDPLVSHRFGIDDAESAYELMESGAESYLGIVINYPRVTNQESDRMVTRVRSESDGKASKVQGKISCGILGAGNFARMVLLPAIKDCDDFVPVSICSAKGLSAKHAADTVGIPNVCTDEDDIVNSDEVDVVFSITRHDQHARHVIKSVAAGKAIFVEKPLCLTPEELNEIEVARENAGEACPPIMVGFNRRFSPATRSIRDFFSDVRSPLTLSFRFNAGFIPDDHWTQDAHEGGGRIIGEACHAIDLCTFLAGRPTRVYAESVAGDGITDDQVHITLRHETGSISHVAYVSSGDKSFPKERMEVFGGGRVAVLDDFRKVSLCKDGKTTDKKWPKQNKGHVDEVKAFANSLKTGTAAIPWKDLSSVTMASILAVRSIREGCPFDF